MTVVIFFYYGSIWATKPAHHPATAWSTEQNSRYVLEGHDLHLV